MRACAHTASRYTFFDARRHELTPLPIYADFLSYFRMPLQPTHDSFQALPRDNIYCFAEAYSLALDNMRARKLASCFIFISTLERDEDIPA